jgi:hypothetical protein
MTSKRMPGAFLALIMIFCSCGCTRYYRVTDPASGKAYHTTKVDRSRRGFVRFEDARSGAEVTLQASEIQRISKYEFDRDTH